MLEDFAGLDTQRGGEVLGGMELVSVALLGEAAELGHQLRN
jgi:hypothetical protein